MDIWNILEYAAWALSAMFGALMLINLIRIDTTYDNDLLTSSREESDLLRSYDLGVNAYVVKPVQFEDFMDAIKDLGVFWAVLNEPPPLPR